MFFWVLTMITDNSWNQNHSCGYSFITFLDFPVSFMKCSSFWFWDTSGIRMLSPSSNRISLTVSPMMGGSRIDSEMQQPYWEPRLLLSLPSTILSVTDVYLQGCKITSIVFWFSKSREAMLGFLLGRYFFIGKTVCLKFPRAFPLHLIGHPYTNHWQKEMWLLWLI